MSYTRNLTFDFQTPRLLNGSSYVYGVIRTGVKTGDRVIGYKQKIRKKQEATSNFSATYYNLVDAVPGKSSLTAHWNTDSSIKINKSYSGISYLNQTFGSLPSFPSNAALSKLYSNLRETRSQMNGLQFFGELRESLRMIRSPAKSLINNFFKWSNDSHRNILKGRNLQKARDRQRIADALADSWLEAQYGWRPLISDVKDIATTAARLVHDNHTRYDRVVGMAKTLSPSIYQGVLRNAVEPSTDSYPTYRDGSPKVAIFDLYVHTTGEASVRYEAFLRSELTGSSTALERVAQISGLTFENVVPTIYELVPYSFLLDYASNLGQCIEAEFTDVSNVMYSLRTERTINRIHVEYLFNRNVYRVGSVFNGWRYTGFSGSSGRYTEVRRTISRTRLSTLPTPSLEFTLTNSGTKVGNVVALLESSLKRFRV